MNPRALPIKDALKAIDTAMGKPYYLGTDGLGNTAAVNALYGQFSLWLSHIYVLQDLIASGAKRVPMAKIGATIPLDLELAIYRKGREKGWSWTVDPIDLQSAHGGQLVVEYWAGRVVQPADPTAYNRGWNDAVAAMVVPARR